MWQQKLQEKQRQKVKVPAKVKISSAKNLKGKKIAIKWKKVKKANKVPGQGSTWK